MSEYVFEHEGKTYTPSGRIELETDAAEYNKELERQEIAWLKTAPEKVLLYVKAHEYGKDRLGTHLLNGAMSTANGDVIDVHTWLGTRVSTHEWVGPRRSMGFGYHTYRRAVCCKIFGVKYHGWWFESTGDYCRLKKARNQ